MKIKQFLAVLGISLLLILVLDGVWLGFFQKKEWEKQVKKIQGTEMKVKYRYAIVSYLLLLLIPLIVLQVSTKFKFKILDDFLLAFVISFVTYGIFNNTNKAIFTNYDHVYITDWVWGTFMLTFVIIVSVSISKSIKK